MKRVAPSCVLIPLLIASISVHAGVTADGVTAYRLDSFRNVVIFTNVSGHDPFVSNGPLGAGIFESAHCSSVTGGEGGGCQQSCRVH